jgi:hypothetical protein
MNAHHEMCYDKIHVLARAMGTTEKVACMTSIHPLHGQGVG